MSLKDGLALYELDLFELGSLANENRLKRFGKKSYFNINRHINPTNICKDVCQFCAFSASRKNPNPYALSIDEILNIAHEAVQNGAKELHIVSAHNKDVGFDWYFERGDDGKSDSKRTKKHQ